MSDKIKLTLYENGRVINFIERDTLTDPKSLIKSVEEFRLATNEMLTKIIEDDGQLETDYIEDDISSEEEESIQSLSPKKRKT